MSEPLPAGTRVRHYGQQWPDAIWDGTATVIEHFYAGRHLEYRMQRDKPLFGSDTGEWAAWATVPTRGRP